MESRLNRNWISHVLACGWPSVSGGENSQRCAALSARSAKYRLEPADLNVAELTLPDASTWVFTTTLIVPVIVFFALCGISGSTWWLTPPAEFASFAAGGASEIAGAELGVAAD